MLSASMSLQRIACTGARRLTLARTTAFAAQHCATAAPAILPACARSLHRCRPAFDERAASITAAQFPTDMPTITGEVTPVPSFSSSQPNGTLNVDPTLLPPALEITDALVNQYADKKARGVSIKEMLEMGSNPAYLLTAAQWLWAELPVRLAKRLRDLDDLPFGLSKSAEVQQLMRLYRHSLSDALLATRPTTSQEELQFTEVLKKILLRHQSVVVDLASGINAGFLKSTSGGRPPKQHFLLQEFLDRFNMARIGLRLLMAQHVALHRQPPDPGFVGVIEVACDPEAVVRQAIADATAVCRARHGRAPRVVIQNPSAKAGGIRPFPYVSAHLRAMCFELLKNSMRATVDHARRTKLDSVVALDPSGAPPTLDGVEIDLPPIVVVLVDGESDVTIKISDRGGGIKRADLPLVFTYTYSASSRMQSAGALAAADVAAARAHEQTMRALAAGSTSAPAASLDADALPGSRDWLTGENFQPTINTTANNFRDAFGLPITRLYARYLGGDLQLFSMAGYGTDAFLYIARPEGNFHEVIQD